MIGGSGSPEPADGAVTGRAVAAVTVVELAAAAVPLGAPTGADVVAPAPGRAAAVPLTDAAGTTTVTGADVTAAAEAGMPAGPLGAPAAAGTGAIGGGDPPADSGITVSPDAMDGWGRSRRLVPQPLQKFASIRLTV